MPDTGVAVVGAGVVGLAIAARLAPRVRDLVILERRDRHGQETSSRNSEVIHAGIYYPTGSLKARLCVEGNRRIYALCAAHAIPHRQTGKIITAAAAAELPALDTLLALGTANGVEMRRLTAAETLSLEPHIVSAGSLFAPSTGIVNVHALMDHLLQAARGAGAILQAHSALVAIERRSADYKLTVRTGGDLESFTTERLVNAAGLEADSVAALAGIDVDAVGYRLHYCKGSYFSVVSSKAGLVTRLVYPVPGHESLGVHAVVGLDGRLKFGPDTEYLSDRRIDYSVDEAKLPAFGEAVRRLVPAIRDEDLTPDMSGIRPKLQGPGDPFRDFVIVDEHARGLPGFVNLVGIDSPGLTSAPAIAEHVAGMMGFGG
jgi:L-2-hydroxyglutarate oxidase LhgO